jgi:hypothetical protein
VLDSVGRVLLSTASIAEKHLVQQRFSALGAHRLQHHQVGERFGIASAVLERV